MCSKWIPFFLLSFVLVCFSQPYRNDQSDETAEPTHLAWDAFDFNGDGNRDFVEILESSNTDSTWIEFYNTKEQLDQWGDVVSEDTTVWFESGNPFESYSKDDAIGNPFDTMYEDRGSIVICNKFESNSRYSEGRSFNRYRYRYENGMFQLIGITVTNQNWTDCMEMTDEDKQGGYQQDRSIDINLITGKGFYDHKYHSCETGKLSSKSKHIPFVLADCRVRNSDTFDPIAPKKLQRLSMSNHKVGTITVSLKVDTTEEFSF